MKTFFQILGLTFLGGAILFGWVTWLNSQQEKENVKSQVLSVSDYSNYPSVQNIAPTNAYVGNEYSYLLSIVDKDTKPEDIWVEIVQGPSWLSIDGFNVFGTPTKSDIGSNEVVLKISDGTHEVYDTFYILVSNGNENK